MEAEKLNESCWQDITEEFRNSVSQLKLGELLKTEQFTLLEAMSAIELMDPKMDSGMICKKINRRILTLDQSIKAGTVKVANLEIDELIGIMDETYACLVTWLGGHPLAQTVMTNLYLHDTERLEDRCLRVFSQAILRIVEHLDRLVNTIFCIEEEDFQTNNNMFNLANQINEQKILNSLEDLCQHYERHHSGQHHNHNHDHNHQESENSKSPQNEVDTKKMMAIANRLRFTQNFYLFLQNVSKNLLKDHTVNGPNSATLIQKTVKLFQSHVSVSDRRLDKCLSFLKKWNETIEIGMKPVSRADNDTNTNSINYPTIMGFDPLINLKLLPAAYPRSPSIKTRPETLECLQDLIVKLKECITLSNSFYQKSFNKSLEALEQFSKYFRPKSCVISRSFIQALYLPTRLTNSNMLKDELYQSMSEYCEPMMQILKKDVTKSLAMNEFLEESSRIFTQVVTLYGHNPARQHEKFPDLILAFKNLQYSAYLVNDVLKNTLVYSWTTYYFAKYCIKYVLSGLELEIFSPHEYPYVFYYLYDILYRNEKEQLEYARRLAYESHYALEQEQASKQGGKAKGNGIKKNKRRTPVNTSFHDKNLLLNDAMGLLAGGMFLLTYGLKVQGKIRTPSFEFTSEEICFDHRFGSITGSSVFQAYRLTLSRLEKLDSIYREAFECFSEARVLFEKHGEGQEKCLNVCKTNMVVAKILSSNSNSFADKEVEFCFDRHPGFPTVKL